MRLPLTSSRSTRPFTPRFEYWRGVWRTVPPWVLPVGLQVAAVVFWLVGLLMIDLDRLDDYGLVSQLPVVTYVALTFMALAFVLALTARELRPIVLAANLVLLGIMLYAITVFIEDAPRFATTYVHAGFAEAIGRTGQRFPNLDARFDWPGFFAMTAYLEQVTGVRSLDVSPLVPVASNLLYLPPLWLLYRSISPDRRLAWLALWVFLAANWIGQDYMSPQGFNYLLYVVILAMLVHWFRFPDGHLGWVDRLWAYLIERVPHRIPIHRRWRTDARALVVDGFNADAWRPGVVIAIAVLFAVDVSSHQLTPFVVLLGTTALVVVSRMSLRSLPLLMAVMIAAWVSYMTVTFLAGHLAGLLSDVGQADAVTEASVGRRLRGSEGHLAIVYFRLVLSLVIWIGAAFGALRRLWYGKLDLITGLLALIPFGMLALQSYGGEILLRVFFFGLPFIAFFLAAGFRPRRGRMGAGWTVAMAVGLAALAIAMPIARYGNERADRMTRLEIAAVDELYQVAEPGSLISTGNYNSPIRFRDTELFRYRSLSPHVANSDVDSLITYMSRADTDCYLLMTRSMQATAEMFTGLPPGEWDAMVAELRTRPEVEVVLENADAIVFKLLDSSPTAP
jgi:hypothetical protein